MDWDHRNMYKKQKQEEECTEKNQNKTTTKQNKVDLHGVA